MMNARELLDRYKDKTYPKCTYNENLQDIYDTLEEDGLLEERIFEGNFSLAAFLFEIISYLQQSEKNNNKEHFRLKNPKMFIEWATAYGTEEYLYRIKENHSNEAAFYARVKTKMDLYNILHMSSKIRKIIRDE